MRTDNWLHTMNIKKFWKITKATPLSNLEAKESSNYWNKRDTITANTNRNARAKDLTFHRRKNDSTIKLS